jgi:SWI/SNF-related matrix-associated actin-dependent regulator 1 of chromatin subfamily A
MQAFMIRMRRDDVIELPNKGRTALAIEGSGKAARDYFRIEDDLIAFLMGEDREWRGAARNEALVRMNLLRHTAGLAKVDGVVNHVHDILDNEPGGVFIVAEHHDVMDALGLKLRYPIVEVRGGMDDYEKQDAVDAFTSGRARVMIGQVTAAGVGLTLHGGGTNTRVVVAQLPWTPADLRQAEDRLHRIGQTKDVQVEIALCALENRWTIDERLWGVLEQKAFQTGELIDGEGEFLLESIQDGVLDSYR